MYVSFKQILSILLLLNWTELYFLQRKKNSFKKTSLFIKKYLIYKTHHTSVCKPHISNKNLHFSYLILTIKISHSWRIIAYNSTGFALQNERGSTQCKCRVYKKCLFSLSYKENLMFANLRKCLPQGAKQCFIPNEASLRRDQKGLFLSKTELNLCNSTLYGKRSKFAYFQRKNHLNKKMPFLRFKSITILTFQQQNKVKTISFLKNHIYNLHISEEQKIITKSNAKLWD